MQRRYVRSFDPEKLKSYVWKQRSNNNEYINASAPCLTGTSVEELFYCKDHFRDAIEKLEKREEEWFVQWKNLLHDLAKDIWLEIILNDGSPEDNGQPFDEDDADGFIKAMDQYVLHFCPGRNAKTCQLRATGNLCFKFKRGIEVSTHISRFRQILKYHAERLPGTDTVQLFDSTMIIFESIPKSWKESFLNKGTGNFDECKLVNIQQYMDQSAIIAANNDMKYKQDNKNKSDNGKHGGRGWRSHRNREEREN